MVKEAIREVVDRPFSATFGKLFRFFGKTFWLIFFLLVIFFLGVFIWAFASNGNSNYPIVNYVYTAVVDPFVNSGAGQWLIQKGTFISNLFTSKGQTEVLKESSWEGSVDASTKANYGVKINRFQATDSTIEPDSTNEVIAVVEGSILTLEDTSVAISCLIEDKEITGQEKEIYVVKNIEEYFSDSCNFPISEFTMDKTRASESQTIKLKVSYDFTTESSLIIYTLNEENKQGKDPETIFSGITNKYLDKKTGLTEFVYTNGPLALELSSMNTQPYSINEKYILGIRLNDNSKWVGELENIEELDILLSDGLKLEDSNFKEIGTENQLTVYGAKDETITQLYNQCKIKETNKIDSTCWKQAKMQLLTNFVVNKDYTSLKEELIKARIKYRFGEIKQDTLTFIYS